MFYNHYVLAPDYLRKELEYLITGSADLRGIRTAYYSPSMEMMDGKAISDIIRKFQCHNDVLLLCENTYQDAFMPEEYCSSLKINEVESIYGLFAEKRILQERQKENTFIIVAGWIEKWEDNMRFIDQFDGESGRLFSEKYSSILVLDTGLHFNLLSKAEVFSKHTGVPFKILFVGMEYFKLNFDNLLLQWSVEKKQDQVKQCNKKAASYAMSLDFIKTIADVTDESMAIESTCKLFGMMFAPKNVVYYSLHDGSVELKYFKSSEPEKDVTVQLTDSDADYMVFDEEDGFAIKISTADALLGIIEIHGVAFPEYLDEYLSVGHDLAKASGLAISNIRRYHEIFSSREEQAKLADMLRTTNRILRHDIANDLHIIIMALDMFIERDDEKYLSMIKNAALKGASLIKDIKELDQVSAGGEQLEPFTVKSMVDSITSKHTVQFNVTGDCIVMADKALSSVIDNIVNNAVIHGGASKIDIEIMSHGDICEISIADNGIGIPDEVKPRLFDEGYKYGESGNTGFGLYIVRKTVERYNGNVWVEDNEPTGAKFIIELNAARPDN